MEGKHGFILGICLLALGLGYYAGVTAPEEKDGTTEIRSQTGFDLNPMSDAQVPAPREQSPAPLRDAVAASPAPLLPAASAFAPRPAAAAAAAASAASAAALAERRPAPPALKEMLFDPAAFLLKRTHLGRPREFAAFVRDPRRVSAYLESPVTRAVLDRPFLVKEILSRPSLVKAFLESPAMRDPAALAALLKSPLVAGLLKSPGVAAALSDPAVARGLLADPQALMFLAKNGDAARSLQSLAPALR